MIWSLVIKQAFIRFITNTRIDYVTTVCDNVMQLKLVMYTINTGTFLIMASDYSSTLSLTAQMLISINDNAMVDRATRVGYLIRTGIEQSEFVSTPEVSTPEVLVPSTPSPLKPAPLKGGREEIYGPTP